MRRRLILGYVVLAAVVLVVLEVPLGVIFARRERDNLTTSLQRDATVLAVLSSEPLEHGDTARLQSEIASYKERSGYEAIITDRTGRPLAATEGDQSSEPASDIRFALDQVFAGTELSGVRRDESQDVFYVALPISNGNSVIGAALLTYPTAPVDSRVARLWLELGILAASVLATAVLVGLLLARWIIEPLNQLEAAAVELGSGRLGSRSPTGSGPPEVRELAGTFNDMAARLEELVDAQSRFVADASHQLRSPLTALRLRLENLPEGPEADAAVREVQRLSRIVDGLLTISRAEGTRPERRAIDAVSIIEERCAAWLALAEERQVALRFADAPATPLYASLVPGYLEQVLDNLLANALEVAPPGSDVTISAETASGAVGVVPAAGSAAHHAAKQPGPGGPADTALVRLTVADEGPGMGEAERRQAFVRFWRGESDRGTGGSGLGIAIVAQLVRACGGRITLEPRSPGLAAVIDLPRADAPKPAPLNPVATGR